MNSRGRSPPSPEALSGFNPTIRCVMNASNNAAGLMESCLKFQVFPKCFLPYQKRLKEFECRDDDVWVASFPKCGEQSRDKDLIFISILILHNFRNDLDLGDGLRHRQRPRLCKVVGEGAGREDPISRVRTKNIIDPLNNQEDRYFQVGRHFRARILGRHDSRLNSRGHRHAQRLSEGFEDASLFRHASKPSHEEAK